MFASGKLGVVEMWISSKNGTQIMDSESLWSAACGELAISLSPAGFSGFVRPCVVKSVTEIAEGRLLVELATTSTYHNKTVEEKFYSSIKQALEKVSKMKVDLALVVNPKSKEEVAETSKKREAMPEKEEKIGLFSQPIEKKGEGVNLNPRYTFDAYMVGKSNELAYAAARSAVNFPGTKHNPLFIYGGVGVGKTHLMHAVGHELVKLGVGKVVCVTSEQFTNDLVASFRSKMTDAFKKKFRNVGALLIDDVQFFGGKDQTQEEFFHTFNELTSKSAQIVMTSDRKPNDIVGLEDRLRSRFAGGMMVDIGLPDYEMRMAIVQQRVIDSGIQADSGVCELIANSFQTNARELEGVFMRLVGEANLKGNILTKEIVQERMGLPMSSIKEVKVRPIKIISTTAKYFGFKNKDLLGPSRKADLVVARHITIYLLRDILHVQHQKLGELMGGRDHTTIMHAVEKIEKEMRENTDTMQKVAAVKRALYT